MDLAGQRKDSGVSLCRHLLAKVEIGPPLDHPRGPHGSTKQTRGRPNRWRNDRWTAG